MKFVVAPDSFKETLTAKEAAAIMESCIRRRYPDADIAVIPVADGGEGTAECIAAACGGTMIYADVTFSDRKVNKAGFAMLPDGTAVVDIAAASGIWYARGKVLPDAATTYGTGELIGAAIRAGAGRIIIGLGGSATHDLACGCAAALGVRFYNSAGETFVPVGATLKDVADIDVSGISLPHGADVTVLCDVDITPFGEGGAACVYAPQKGADADMCMMLDEGTRHLCEVISSSLGIDVSSLRGGGAAGASGAGLYAFLGAKLRRGIDAVLDITGFDAAAKNAEAVFTGEGRTDRQTPSGKAIYGVAKRAKAVGSGTIVISGSYDEDEKLWDALSKAGVKRIYSVTDGKRDIASLRLTAADDLRRRTDEILNELRF